MLDAELLGETECREAVDDAEIDRLRRSAVLGSLREGADSKDLLSGARVNVFAASERLGKHGIARKMRHHPQFDLGIIGGEKDLSFFCDERRPDLPPQLRADGNVL